MVGIIVGAVVSEMGKTERHPFNNSMISGFDLERSGTTIDIYDMLGRKMIKVPFTNSISTAVLPQGFYIVHIQDGTGSINHMHKIIINK